MKNAPRHFLRGDLFHHKSIFGRFLDPGRLPKWPSGHARNASNASSNLVAIQKPSRPAPGSLPGGFREASGHPQGPPGHHFGTIFLTIFEVNFNIKSYSDILFFAPAFLIGSFAWARDSD